METRINVNGRITAAEEAQLPVLDHGFLFGDSVYEVFWWHRGVLIQEAEHLDRLERSAGRLYMDLQVGREALVEAVEATVRAAGATDADDAYIRLIVTRGVGPLGLDFREVPRRSIIVIAAPANRPDEATVRRGIHVAFIDRRRMSIRALDPGAKTGNYLNNVLAQHEARLAGADDAVLLNDEGHVTEATTANVYVVREGALATPPMAAGILRGTTRTRILLLCADAGIRAREITLAPEDLREADEVFLSSSVRGILPVTAIDDAPVGDGAMGPITAQLRARFEAAADEEAARGGGAEAP